jgi:hypothetical protein
VQTEFAGAEQLLSDQCSPKSRDQNGIPPGSESRVPTSADGQASDAAGGVRKGLEHQGGGHRRAAPSQNFAHPPASRTITLNSDWRVIGDPLQWILQRRKRESRRASAKSSPGGWPSARWLEWADVKEINHAVHELVRCGCAPTHLVTVMPSDGDQGARKRACTLEIAHLGQALKRHGKRHVGVTVFEHPVHPDLHAHHLVHAPSGEYATVERRHRPPEVHVERIRELHGVVAYVTKQRRRLPPELEAQIKHPWERCRSVPGKRWKMTTEAKELLIEREAVPRRPLARSTAGIAGRKRKFPADKESQ